MLPENVAAGSVAMQDDWRIFQNQQGGVVGNYYAALKILIGGETVDPYNGQIHFSEPICPDSVNSSAIVQT